MAAAMNHGVLGEDSGEVKVQGSMYRGHRGIDWTQKTY